MGEERCDLTGLPVYSCAHCAGGTDFLIKPPPYGPWFTAAYPGCCSGCDGGIEPGDTIRADGDGGYLCPGCGREEDRP